MVELIQSLGLEPATFALVVTATFFGALIQGSIGFGLNLTVVPAIAAVQQQSVGPNGDVFGLERETSGRHGRIMKYNLNSGNQQQWRDQRPS